MSKVVKKVDREAQIVISDWTEKDARDFLVKGGIVKTKVINYDKDDNITSYCITEKQIAPNYKMHLDKEGPKKESALKKLRKELKQ